MAATLLGGIDPDVTLIAADDDYLYGVAASAGQYWRYNLPSLTNSEGPSSVWSPSADTNFTADAIGADVVNGDAYVAESRSSTNERRVYRHDDSSKTLIGSATISGITQVGVTWNPVTGTPWVAATFGTTSRVYEVTGGGYTLIDSGLPRNIRQLSVDGDGYLWASFQDGTTFSHTFRISRWSTTGTRTDVYAEAATWPSGTGVAWWDDSFVFARSTGGSSMEWSRVTAAGAVSAVDWLDGSPGPAADQLFTAFRVGTVGYIEQPLGETAFDTDIWTFEGEATDGRKWWVGVAGWG